MGQAQARGQAHTPGRATPLSVSMCMPAPWSLRRPDHRRRRLAHTRRGPRAGGHAAGSLHRCPQVDSPGRAPSSPVQERPHRSYQHKGTLPTTTTELVTGDQAPHSAPCSDDPAGGYSRTQGAARLRILPADRGCGLTDEPTAADGQASSSASRGPARSRPSRLEEFSITSTHPFTRPTTPRAAFRTTFLDRNEHVLLVGPVSWFIAQTLGYAAVSRAYRHASYMPTLLQGMAEGRPLHGPFRSFLAPDCSS